MRIGPRGTNISHIIQRLVITRMVAITVIGLWAVHLILLTSGYIINFISLDDTLLFEITRTLWFLLVYFPLAIFSITVLDPLLGRSAAEIFEPFGTVGSTIIFSFMLTIVYLSVGLLFSMTNLSIRHLGNGNIPD